MNCPMGRLQDLVDATPDGGLLQLAEGEYDGPVVVRKPITITGMGLRTLIYSHESPCISIQTQRAVLERIAIDNAEGSAGIAIEATVGVRPTVQDVYVTGEVNGVPTNSLSFERLEQAQRSRRAPGRSKASERVFLINIPETSVAHNAFPADPQGPLAIAAVDAREAILTAIQAIKQFLKQLKV